MHLTNVQEKKYAFNYQKNYTPSIPNCKSFSCRKANFFSFEQVYKKMHKHLQHQIISIKSTMTYVLKVHVDNTIEI